MPKRQVKVLRRGSFRVMSWSFTGLFGAATVGAIAILTNGLRSGPMIGVAASLGVIALSRRICGSRIVLRDSVATVINPLLTYTVPYRAIARVAVDSGGTLIVVTCDGNEIHATGFAGSIIDSLVGSTDRAVGEFEKRLKLGKGDQKAEVSRAFTISWVADFCAAGAGVFAVGAAIVGA